MGILPDWMIREAKCIAPFAEGIKRPGAISYGVSSYGYDARIGYKFKVFSPINATVIDPKNFDPNVLVDVDLTPQDVAGTPLMNSAGDLLESHLIDRVYKASNRVRPKDHILIPPHSFALGETVEEFNIPRDCLAVVLGKSTYARCGIIVNVTPLEPEWKGKVTVEISNTTPLPAVIYAGEGIMQVLFFRTDGVTEALLNAVRRMCGQNAQNLALKFGFADQEFIQDTETLLHQELPRGTCRTSYADKKGKYQNQEGLTLPTVDKTETNTGKRKHKWKNWLKYYKCSVCENMVTDLTPFAIEEECPGEPDEKEG